MTDAALATYAVVANEIEMESRATEGDSEERAAADAVLRQAVALRKVLEGWIVKRALRRANREHAALVR